MQTRGCSIVLLLASVAYAALPLPPYIKPCARTDPNFYECSLQSAKEAVPHIVNGEKKYGIPPFDPIEISEITVDSGPDHAGLNINLKNIKLTGMRNSDLKEMHYDIENSVNKFVLTAPVVNILADYTVKGRILLLPISGKGPVNVTIVNGKFIFTADTRLVTKKDGLRYAEFFNPTFTVEPERVYFRLENLFDGNKLLGEEMNTVLNAEWKETMKEVGGPIIQAVRTIVLNLTNNFASRVPYDVWFPEKL